MKRQYKLPQWNWKNLLLMLGTANEIGRMLEERGYHPPPRTTIQGWRNRNMVPADWVPVFIKLAIEGQFIRDIDDLRESP